jgi:hypothetical protein
MRKGGTDCQVCASIVKGRQASLGRGCAALILNVYNV